MPGVVGLEICADDPERASASYRGVFGTWERDGLAKLPYPDNSDVHCGQRVAFSGIAE